MVEISLKEYLKTSHKSYINYKIERGDFINYLNNLKKLCEAVKQAAAEGASEENIKNLVICFLKETYYGKRIDIQLNTFNRIDYAIKKNENIEVIMEFKNPANKQEMITPDNLNKKALHEAIKYFYDERYKNNYHIKNILITDGINYFIFNPTQFLHKELEDICYSSIEGDLCLQNTLDIYKAIADVISRKNITFNYVLFNLKYIENQIKDFDLNNVDTNDKSTRNLLYIYKLFHPDFLLNEYSPKDSNQLNKKFYDELLYILGLEEVNENSKKVIKPNPNKYGLINETIEQLKEQKELDEGQATNIAFELIITWLNRILFLKLFEAQLVSFNDDKNFKFITSDKINDFDKLYRLFFSVLGKKIEERTTDNKNEKIPYLNSSLFEQSNMEVKYFSTTALNNDKEMPLYKLSVLKNWPQYKNKSKEKILKYLLDFLDSFDFSSTNSNIITEENRDIINSAVLGLIFEKLNGYKDGSFYTPGFITEYMVKECIEKAVIDKFNDALGIKAASIQDLKNYLSDKNYITENLKNYNNIINSLRICDPAVGSGHFLVSALNYIIYLKSYLGILWNGSEKITNNIEIFDDTLVVFNQNDTPFTYKRQLKSTHSLQQALFNEKRTIIENCLFAVDINPKSVYICQLRLWIELLKNTYYINNSDDMEVLPNIDINIKTGNSLISKYPVNVGAAVVQEGSKEQKENIKIYKQLVAEYKKSGDKKKKKEINDKLADIKKKLYSVVENVLVAETSEQEKLNKEIKKLKQLKKKAKTIKEINKIEEKISKLQKETRTLVYGDSIENPIYSNSMEWMLEFPEVLDENGKFQGFDIVIGNPPFIDSEAMTNNDQGKEREYISQHYSFAKGNWDIYIPFFNLAYKLIKHIGYSAYVSPDKWLAKPFGFEMRKKLLENIYKIIKAGRGVFDSATVDSILTFFSKKKNSKIRVAELIKGTPLNFIDFDKCRITDPYTLDYLFSKHINIIEKIERYKNIKEMFSVNAENACATSDAYILKEVIQETVNFDDETMLKFVNTGTIDKYITKWSYKPATYIKSKYTKPIVLRKDFKDKFKNSYYNKTFSPKIIIKGLTLLDACIDFDGNVIPGKSTIVILCKDTEKLKLLASLINNNVSAFYLSQKNLSSSYCGGINFTPDMINSIPVPEITKNQKSEIINIVNKILSVFQSSLCLDDKKNKINKYNKEINSIYYKLYGLTDEEIEIVENSFK